MTSAFYLTQTQEAMLAKAAGKAERHAHNSPARKSRTPKRLTTGALSSSPRVSFHS